MGVLNELNELVNDDMKDISAESFVVNPVGVIKTQSPFTLSNYSVDQKLINKLSQMVDLAGMRVTIGSESKITKAVAAEVFTMIGEDSPANLAKLTNAPSEANKEVLDKLISKVPTRLDDNELGSLKSLRDQISIDTEVLERVQRTATADHETLSAAFDILSKTKIVIMTQNQIYDLFQSSLTELAYSGIQNDEYMFNVDIKSLLYKIVESEEFKSIQGYGGNNELSLKVVTLQVIGELVDLNGSINKLLNLNVTIDRVIDQNSNTETSEDWLRETEYLLKELPVYSEYMAIARKFNSYQEDPESWYANLIALVVGLSQ